MEVKLTPEEIIQWLESYRRLMFEVWEKNPELYERHLKLQRRDQQHSGK